MRANYNTSYVTCQKVKIQCGFYSKEERKLEEEINILQNKLLHIEWVNPKNQENEKFTKAANVISEKIEALQEQLDFLKNIRICFEKLCCSLIPQIEMRHLSQTALKKHIAKRSLVIFERKNSNNERFYKNYKKYRAISCLVEVFNSVVKVYLLQKARDINKDLKELIEYFQATVFYRNSEPHLDEDLLEIPTRYFKLKRELKEVNRAYLTANQ